MSHHQSHRMLAAAGALALGTALLGGLPASAEGEAEMETVATGLNSPRHLTFSPDGTLYVAESGTGGPADGNCHPHPALGVGCFGFTGSIARVGDDGVERVVTGLPSVASESEAIGPFDIAFTGNHRFAITVGLGASPAVRASFGPDATHLGSLATGTLHPRHDDGAVTYELDTLAYEVAHDVDGDPDSNPTGLARSGGGYVFTDAGGNTLVSTRKGGSTIASFAPVPTTAPVTLPDGTLPPGFPADAVPTDVVQGPDGAWYVSQLVGFPFEKGSSTIWRVVPGQAPEAYATGLTNVTSLDFAEDGTLYAVELSTEGLMSGGPIGALREIVPGSDEHPVVAGGLNQPYGLEIRGEDAYLTLGAIGPADGGGSVVRIGL